MICIYNNRGENNAKAVEIALTNNKDCAILKPMDTTLLRKAGLTESQAKGYLALIEHGDLSPAELADKTGESRTNGYMICEKLESLGLATKKDGQKATYSANHPSALETLAEKRRKVLMRNEQEVKQGLSPLIDMFYQFREQPGARTLQGIEGIKEVFADVIRTGADVYFIRTTADIQTLPDEFFQQHQKDRAVRGVQTYALTPLSEHAKRALQQGLDEQNSVHRTFYPAETYTEPVEIQIYGDKLAFIAYGETQMATIITSPPIAEAMKQFFRLLSAQLQEYSDGVKQQTLASDRADSQS